MRFKSIRFLVALCVAMAMSPCKDAGAQSNQYEQDRVVVRFSEPTLSGLVDSLLGGYGVLPELPLNDGATYLVTLPSNLTVEIAAVAFAQQPTVIHAGPNYFCRIVEGSQMSQAVLDGDSEAHAAGISPSKFYSQAAVAQVLINEGHLAATGSGILVAHIDNGIDLSHTLFTGRLSPLGYDFVDHDSDPSYTAGENEGHGTFGAGLLLLSAPGVEILPIRSLDGDGLGTIFDAVLGIEYALEQAADVIVLGFGLYVDDPVLKSAIHRADSAGVLVIAAAGNDDQELPIRYPAGYPEVIGVGAVDTVDTKASFSNFGLAVDICAPGVALYSALPGSDNWGTWNGTSFSTPLVAGLAALVQQLHPDVPPRAIRSIIAWGCDDIDSLNPLHAGQLGGGRINFARSTGYETPLVSLRGWATDSVSVGLANVEFVPSKDGIPSVTSYSVTDDDGFYVSTLPAGMYDLIYNPPAGYGLQTTTLTTVSLMSDTVVTAVLSQSQATCVCVWQADLDMNGFVNSTDLSELIDAVFFGSPNPQDPNCPIARGDFNSDGFTDSTDLADMTDHVFFGGPLPVDPCTP